ncbi:MAG: NADH:flavin oxidoreductase [Chloroflexota bacterium]
MKIRRVAALRTPELFRDYLAAIGAEIDFDEDVESGGESPLAQPCEWRGRTIGNRFAILPMEGWDAEQNGHPSDLVRRRWTHFGQSGAKLIWGCEAVAVRHNARANPNQLVISPDSVDAFRTLRQVLVDAHESHHGESRDLLIGLQLTHSGRFSKPDDLFKMKPQTLYRHPILDAKFGITDDSTLMRDEDIDKLIGDFIQGARLAKEAGFDFVDLKHCHGYLGHEFLTAMDRPGKYGGSFENRTRFIRELVEGIRSEVPGIEMGVRLSAIDFIPFQPDPEQEGKGIPAHQNGSSYPYAFGADSTGLAIDLREPLAFLDLLAELQIDLINITAGSPYYTPHLIRPALFPPSDGYQPPEDPLLGVARHINLVAELKKQRPDFLYVGSGYSYLQDWLPNVAQHVIRSGRSDFVGIGRMVLSYPDFCADVLAGRSIQRKRICRTFSDCTTGPRNGMISGCFPLDNFYKQRPEYERLQEIKAG